MNTFRLLLRVASTAPKQRAGTNSYPGLGTAFVQIRLTRCSPEPAVQKKREQIEDKRSIRKVEDARNIVFQFRNRNPPGCHRYRENDFIFPNSGKLAANAQCVPLNSGEQFAVNFHQH